MSDALVDKRFPERIGRYEVAGFLAAGGMAEILLGRLVGPSGFERAVVIKRILPHLARVASVVDMFIDEARIVGGIHHPNVVNIHELGREDGELFLVMEYLEGESVGGIMRRLWAMGEPLDATLAAHIVAEACAGLHAAHELTDADGFPRNLVHRDVTPHNVFVTYDGGVKVLDFGIAKAADRITRTEAGQVKGKFAYMSPEQCKGRNLDRRSDVFALGIVLYELTVRRQLFRRSTELQTLKAISEQPIPTPSSMVADYPPCLERICKRALAQQRDDRYATAADMRRDLLAAMRELGGDVAPEEGMRAIMHRVFADRMAEKREMLRRVRSGSVVTHVPPAETDEAVELPAQGDDDGQTHSDASLPTDSARPDVAPRRRGALRSVAVVAGIAGVLGVAAFAARERSSSPPVELAASSAPLASASTAPAAASAPASAVEPAGEVVLSIATTPPGARVFVDDQDRGLTPMDLRVPRGHERLSLQLRRDGYVALDEGVVPDVDQRLVLTMRPSGRPPVRAPETKATAQPSASAPRRIRRFD